MKKILLVFLMVCMSLTSLSQVNDELGVLSKDEEAKLEKVIEEASEKTGLDFYINYLNDGETQQLKEVEKSVIINLVKVDNKNIKVAVNFTQDIQIEEYKGEIEKTLGNLEEFLNEGKNFDYSRELLNSLEEVILRSQKEAEVQKEEFVKKGNNKSKFLILFLLIGGVVFYRKKMKISKDRY